MRWFIEVSRVGESAATEKYCLEAKQWQAALQEARKLRGDSGPLSKFSIELLDDGYRAVDPKLKLRYVVAKAPNDAPISVPGNSAEHAPEAAPRTEPMAAPEPLPPPSSPAPSSARAEPGPKTDPMGLPPPSAPVTEVPSAAPATTERAVAQRPASSPPGHGYPTQRSLEAAKPPDFQLIRKREEEPNEKAPIVYREYAYAVKPGTTTAAAEVLLWFRFREIQSSIEDRPDGKFVQLAVFDHVFERKPIRPPIATLAWKDWRGEPMLNFPDPSSRLSSAPPPAPSFPPPKAVPVSERPSAPVAETKPSPPSTPPPAPEPERRPPTTPPAEAAPAPEPAPAAAAAPEPKPEPAPAAAPSEPQPKPEQRKAEPKRAAAAEPTPEKPKLEEPSKPAKAKKKAKAKPEPEPVPAGPPPPRRRAKNEDLISELFETMHDLHFVADVVSGSQFVLGILQQMLPSEGVIVHIFDINTRHFVAVRAAGPSSAKVLLHRTPDKDELLSDAMRRTRSLRFEDATKDERFSTDRWELLGVKPKSVLLGPVQQGGRYLGAVELANPQGGEPYHEGESNALDYICEQFAEFIAARPIVVDADVVLGKGS